MLSRYIHSDKKKGTNAFRYQEIIPEYFKYHIISNKQRSKSRIAKLTKQNTNLISLLQSHKNSEINSTTNHTQNYIALTDEEITNPLTTLIHKLQITTQEL